jgi:hypothetical protein
MKEALKLALEALENNRQTHHYCEDTWYSCPKHEDGCANDSEGDECNCGADKANAEIDKAITAIKEALAQPEQEPVAWITEWEGQYSSGKILDYIAHTRGGKVEYTPLYTTPPQRTWVGLTEKDICEAAVKSQDGISPRNDTLRFAIAIEAKLKEKNT